ncbi:MAG TPA: phospholipid carrier-dependent glycosyltransferase [Pseudonocardiaceae bacterium]|nr:phospholipid carrier-dependent glycosyltransferase [Pseudonocardiaceae bacterium]
MPADRLRGWLNAIVITAIGAVVRFQNLGYPIDHGTPVFDEKYYAAQAWQMLRNGGYEDNPGYELVVHPPVGKYFIAIGEWLFGYNGFGWRFMSAVAGTLMILLIIRIARRLTRSTLLGGVAGILFICDGLSHVQARLGMLDVFLALFVLIAFGCVLNDRDQMRERLRRAEGFDSVYGPRLGFRWWRFAAGVSIGISCAVKWDGLYWLAAFFVLTILWDWRARKAAGIARPFRGMLVRDLLPAIWGLIIVPVLCYLGCWWAWLSSETGIDRHSVGGNYPYQAGQPVAWFLSWTPDALRYLLHYSGNVLYFHEHLVTPPGNPHPLESKPWAWPMSLRPMLIYYAPPPQVSAVMMIGTPAMWWLAFPMLGWAIWRVIGRYDWRYLTVLVAYLAGLLPWFLNLDRQMFFFYMTPDVAFMILGLVLPLGEILERRRTGILVVSLYVGVVVANFAWLWPILNGEPISASHWYAELWLPSWNYQQ